MSKTFHEVDHCGGYQQIVQGIWIQRSLPAPLVTAYGKLLPLGVTPYCVVKLASKKIEQCHVVTYSG